VTRTLGAFRRWSGVAAGAVLWADLALYLWILIQQGDGSLPLGGWIIWAAVFALLGGAALRVSLFEASVVARQWTMGVTALLAAGVAFLSLFSIGLAVLPGAMLAAASFVLGFFEEREPRPIS